MSAPSQPGEWWLLEGRCPDTGRRPIFFAGYRDGCRLPAMTYDPNEARRYATRDEALADSPRRARVELEPILHIWTSRSSR